LTTVTLTATSVIQQQRPRTRSILARAARRLPTGVTPEVSGPSDLPLRSPDQETPYWRPVHLDRGAAAWHLVYLAGLVPIGLRTAVGLARGREEQPVPRWRATAGVLPLVLGGVAQVRSAGGRA
jgi:hypothetical protein